MISKTSESAIQTLVYLALRNSGEPVAPRRIAEVLGLSPSYLQKVAALLVRAGVLRALRGSRGGLLLDRKAEDITLLEIVEASEGRILGAYCQDADDLDKVCAFHRAMAEVHKALVGALGRWTLADLAAGPCPAPELAEEVDCRMANLRPALEPAVE